MIPGQKLEDRNLFIHANVLITKSLVFHSSVLSEWLHTSYLLREKSEEGYLLQEAGFRMLDTGLAYRASKPFMVQKAQNTGRLPKVAQWKLHRKAPQ